MLPAPVTKQETATNQTNPLSAIVGVDVLKWDDCTYRLMSFLCPNCGARHFRVARQSGAFYSLYIPPDHFEASDFEAYCRELHENMQFDRGYILTEVRAIVSERNGTDGITSDGSYLDQLMDFARLRLRALADSGDLKRIEDGSPRSRRDRALMLAFELGYAASDLRLRDYEDAIYEGWRQQEAREQGREAAVRAKERTTRKTRAAIKVAALELYGSQPGLVRNDAATARAIEKLHLPDLCRNGRGIGSAAIQKHLRALRASDAL
jgi:hypothetical protein